jgi:hypothetical protein
MNEPTERSADPRIQTAIVELQDLIIARFPSTTFEIGEDDDPDGVYVRAVVDVDDTDEVTELFIDRMIDIQVDDGLPVYVVPVRTPERQAAARQKLREERMALYG